MQSLSISPKESKTIQRALCILESAMRKPDAPEFSTAEGAGEYARLRLGSLEREELHVFWLDAKHRLIAAESMFIGTIDKATVHPREVVKSAMRHNAAAAIVAHNHPSGDTTPSNADITMTAALKTALSLVDVRLLDHFVVSGGSANSMFQMGLIK